METKLVFHSCVIEYDKPQGAIFKDSKSNLTIFVKAATSFQ